MRVEAVVSQHNGLGILEFGERLHVKAIVGAKAVGLRSREIRALSPTVAECRYAARRKRSCRECRSGWASSSGMRLRPERWKSSFIITPRALARPGFMPAGKFRAHTAPFSMSQLNEGSGTP